MISQATSFIYFTSQGHFNASAEAGTRNDLKQTSSSVEFRALTPEMAANWDTDFQRGNNESLSLFLLQNPGAEKHEHHEPLRGGGGARALHTLL